MIFKFGQFLQLCVLGLFIFFAQGVSATPKKLVYSTIPELAWVVDRIGDEAMPSEALLEAGVNAHYVDAKPSFIMKLRKADMLCSVGLGLEGAWLSRAVERSFNSKLQSTHACVVGAAISVIGRPKSAKDRSHGHLHSEGNPHFWYAPSRMIEAVEYMAKRLKFLAEGHPSQIKSIDNNAKKLADQLRALLKEARIRVSKNSIKTVSQYHSDFDYVIADLGLERVMSIESKPGVPPSTAQLSQFKKTMQEKKVKVILSLPWDPQDVVSKLAQNVGAKVVEWPAQEKDYLKAFDIFVSRLDEALQ